MQSACRPRATTAAACACDFDPAGSPHPCWFSAAQKTGPSAPGAVHATARDYGTRAEIFSGMGHNMMLEPGWPLVAERIQAWLAGLGI
ncbi:hypothetical protein MycrhDRAFT_2076 [Mycolicibacterium rhodesiae JS60]|nr:hypothetical protein MycrhDRAFT_2076 [Mycolicibacterium rhodesiae JS60]